MTSSDRTLNDGTPPSPEQKTTTLPLSQPPLWRALLQGELEAERQAHAAAQARHETGTRQVEALERQLLELRTKFSTELERTREQVAVMQERAEATERRALREIDQERTLRQKGEQALGRGQAAQEGLRAELEAARRRAERAQAEATASRRLATAGRRAPATRTKFKPGPA